MIAHKAPSEDRPTIEVSHRAKCVDELERLAFVVKDKLPTGDAAVHVIDRPWDEKTGMSRHEISPTRGRDDPILLSPSHKSTSVEVCTWHSCEVVAKRYDRRKPMIVTSNKSWGAWGEILPDQAMTAAILDRLLHRSVTVNIQGESYRLREHRKAGLIPTPLNPQKEGADQPTDVSNPNR